MKPTTQFITVVLIAAVVVALGMIWGSHHTYRIVPEKPSTTTDTPCTTTTDTPPCVVTGTMIVPKGEPHTRGTEIKPGDTVITNTQTQQLYSAVSEIVSENMEARKTIHDLTAKITTLKAELVECKSHRVGVVDASDISGTIWTCFNSVPNHKEFSITTGNSAICKYNPTYTDCACLTEGQICKDRDGKIVHLTKDGILIPEEKP